MLRRCRPPFSDIEIVVAVDHLLSHQGPWKVFSYVSSDVSDATDNKSSKNVFALER